MKKFTAAAAVLAAAGFTGLSMVPAAAQPAVFERCADAYALGISHIPEGQPGYGRHLDNPYDKVACEGANFGYDATRVPGYVAPVAPVAPAPEVGTTTPVTPINTAVFENCTEARAAGAVNIPATDPRYGTHLDRDLDGIGCEQGTDEVETGTDIIVDTVPESWGNGTGTGYGQVGQVPVGGADTGVTVEESSSVSGLALGGMALVAAAGATFMVRRRAQA